MFQQTERMIVVYFKKDYIKQNENVYPCRNEFIELQQELNDCFVERGEMSGSDV